MANWNGVLQTINQCRNKIQRQIQVTFQLGPYPSEPSIPAVFYLELLNMIWFKFFRRILHRIFLMIFLKAFSQNFPRIFERIFGRIFRGFFGGLIGGFFILKDFLEDFSEDFSEYILNNFV